MRNPSTIIAPAASMSLDDYIQDNGVEHFTATEVRTLRRLRVVAPEPPRRIWPNIIPTLWLAEELRSRMRDDPRAPADMGLIVGNGYRPRDLNRRAGGVWRSPHIPFRAIDLDLPRGVSGDTEAMETFYRHTAEIFLEHRHEYGIGLGLYRAWKGNRVHLDTGRRRSAHWKKAYTTPLLESLR